LNQIRGVVASDGEMTNPNAIDTVARLVERAAATDPAATAILAPGQRASLSYGGLVKLMGSVAAGLAEHGIGPSDRVALVLQNGPEAATAFLSCAVAAVCAPLNPTYRREELDFFLDDLAPRAVIVSSTVDSPVRDSALARGVRIIELEPIADSPAGTFQLDGILAPSRGLPVRARDEHALLLHTSGTTSRPKLVALAQANLAASARNVAATLALAPGDRCLNVMPLFHIHGIVAALLASLRAGAAVACSPGFHPIRVFEWFREVQPTWYTAVPTMHQAVLSRADDHADVIAGLKLRFVRSSSAALPISVLERLEKTFGAPVVEAYGMTEAAHQMASNPLPPANRRPGSVGLPAGPEIAVLSESGEALPPGSVGEVAIRGENVFRGYVENDVANAASFANGWFRTGDEGSIDADGYLTLHGRIKEIINRGGEKVAPVEVDERLLAHPSVAEAVTFAIPDARLGEEVAAAVVLRPGQATTPGELQEFVAATLAPFKVPRKILIVDTIPKGATGKLQRIGLADRLGVSLRASDGGDPTRHARTDYENQIVRIWADVLGLPSVGVDDDFFALGGDSILGAEAIARVRELLGRPEIPLVAIVRSPTVAAMLRELDAAFGVVARSGAVPMTRAEKRPFFFVHGGDGEILGFAALARALANDVSFYGLRARGIDDGEAPCGTIEEMADGYVAALREVQPKGPYLIGGFCLGGAVALEMGHRLEAAGEETMLIVVDPRVARPTGIGYSLWLVRRAARERTLLRSVMGRIHTPAIDRSSPNGGIPIMGTISRLRDAHRPSPSRLPGLMLYGSQHEQYSIPEWYTRRLFAGVHAVHLPVKHSDLLRARGAALIATEVRRALNENGR
jgi:oxalate---CoA ligase